MAEPWTVLKVLQWTAGYLQEQGIEGARLDAELLLTEVLQLDRVGLYVNYDRPLEANELAAYRQLVGRRARREPVAYILGRSEFWSLPLVVRPDVLIPRPDTEVLVEEALQRAVAESRIPYTPGFSASGSLISNSALPDSSSRPVDPGSEICLSPLCAAN